MIKETFLEYLNDVFKPIINDLISLEIHYCFLEFDCESQINLALYEFKKSKSVSKLSKLCLEKLENIEFDDFTENDEIDSFWIHIASVVNLYNNLDNCMYLKTKSYGLFNLSPISSKMSPSEFFVQFRYEYLDGIAEFLKDSLASIDRFIIMRTGNSNRLGSFKYIFNLAEEIISKVSKRNNPDTDFSIIKSIYNLFNEIENTKEYLAQKYGWDEECNINNKVTHFSIEHFENGEYSDEETDSELYELFESFFDSFSELITIYELTLANLESKFKLNVSSLGTIPIENSHFINEYLFRKHELINSEIDWVYNSYCSFMVS